MFRMTRFVDRHSGMDMVRVNGRKESDPLASPGCVTSHGSQLETDPTPDRRALDLTELGVTLSARSLDSAPLHRTFSPFTNRCHTLTIRSCRATRACACEALMPLGMDRTRRRTSERRLLRRALVLRRLINLRTGSLLRPRTTTYRELDRRRILDLDPMDRTGQDRGCSSSSSSSDPRNLHHPRPASKTSDRPRAPRRWRRRRLRL